MPMNRMSARSSCDDSSARWPSIECIRGRTTPPRTMSSMPSRSSRTLATSRALVITVSRRWAISRAKARAVVPLPMAMVSSSATRAAADRAIARFASRFGVAPIGRAGPRGQRRAAVGADDAALACQALEVAADRRGGHAQVVGELGHARAAVGAQVVDQASATLRLPHARILRIVCAHCQRFCAICAQHAISCAKVAHTRSRRLRCRRWPTCLAWSAAWTRAARRAAPSPCWPSTTARTCARSSGRPTPERVSEAEMVEFKRAVVRALGTTGTGVLLDPGDRRRAGDRRRVAAGARRADRRGRGDRLRGRAGGPRQSRAARLGRGAGQAPGGVGRQAARLLPPGRAERRRPGAAGRRRSRRRAASTTSPCSWSRCRSASMAARSPATSGVGWSSRPPAG